VIHSRGAVGSFKARPTQTKTEKGVVFETVGGARKGTEYIILKRKRKRNWGEEGILESRCGKRGIHRTVVSGGLTSPWGEGTRGFGEGVLRNSVGLSGSKENEAAPYGSPTNGKGGG